MMEVSSILEQGNHRSLVVIDELAARTNASEGAALCWALIEALISAGPSLIIATHFTSLTNIINFYPHIRK